MPQRKAKVKATALRDEDNIMIPVVDSDTLALTMIELFSDERVMKRMRDALYPRELVEKLDEMTRRLAVLTTSVKARDDRIKTLESKVAALEHESNKVEQYSRRPNLRFTGIAETDETNENTTEKILDIINEDMSPNAQIRPEQIERSHRLGAKTDRNGKIRQRAIIVRFGHENTRDAVYRARFMLKKKSGPKVFVNEDLTSTRAALAFQTRQLKKKGKVMDCWTAAGKVMVKDNSGHITSESELATYGHKCTMSYSESGNFFTC